MAARFALGVLGPDIQTLASKVFWTFIQTAGGVLLATPVLGWDMNIWEAAAVAGLASVLVPITVYARQMVGGQSSPQAGTFVYNREDTQVRWDD